MTGLHIESRPFPGIVPAPAPDPKVSARQHLEASRQHLANRTPCPPTCPRCFGGHAEATGQWEYFGHAIGPCETCREPCRSTDPEGRRRHPNCEAGEG